MTNKWKVVAIIFIILFTVETMGIIWLYNAGTDIIEKENTCMWETCADADTWYYDSYSNACTCYVGHEIVKTKILR